MLECLVQQTIWSLGCVVLRVGGMLGAGGWGVFVGVCVRVCVCVFARVMASILVLGQGARGSQRPLNSSYPGSGRWLQWNVYVSMVCAQIRRPLSATPASAWPHSRCRWRWAVFR